MELVHMPPPNIKRMVFLPDKEYLAHQGSKALVVSQKGVEALVGLPPEVIPFGEDGLRDINQLTMIVVQYPPTSLQSSNSAIQKNFA